MIESKPLLRIFNEGFLKKLFELGWDIIYVFADHFPVLLAIPRNPIFEELILLVLQKGIRKRRVPSVQQEQDYYGCEDVSI